MLKLRDSYGLTFGAFMGLFFGGLALLMVFIAIFSYQVDKAACVQFEQQTSWDTKFAVYIDPAGIPLSWDCVARTQSGKWVSVDNLREFDN